MPFYTFKCDKCKLIEDRQLKIEDRNNPQKCDTCKEKMQRVVSAVNLSGFDSLGRSK